jgi:hypothetical protein
LAIVVQFLIYQWKLRSDCFEKPQKNFALRFTPRYFFHRKLPRTANTLAALSPGALRPR